MLTSTTMLTCSPVIEQGKHLFKIFGYRKHRGMGHKSFIRSRTFSIGGNDWSIRFYPDGFVKEDEDHADKDHISVFLELLGSGGGGGGDIVKVRASIDMRLVDQTTGLPASVHLTHPRMFIAGDGSRFAPQTHLFKKRSELESSVYLQKDRLTIECIVTVFETKSIIQVPPSDIIEHLGKLLKAGLGADVTFSVGGQTFAGHKFLLAVRSPVLEAQLCGGMKEAREERVTIEGMQPSVFWALLHFIYTDSLPDMDEFQGADDDRNEMIRHLLVAADLYALDRLKLMCQSILCQGLDVKNVFFSRPENIARFSLRGVNYKSAMREPS
jgi:speckle-type POZ protein